MNFNKTLLCLSIAACFSVVAEESENLERIEVTSNFRAVDVTQFPASVSVIPEFLIESRQAQHIEEILNVAANVNFASGASRGKYIQIRGIGERSQFAEPINPSVGFVIDEFDFSGIAGIGTLFDVQQVEVLRGPQATEFGAGALAGLIKVKTTEATAEQQTRFAISLAENNTWSVGGALGSKITDKLFYRVAVQQFKSDGFIENIHLNRKDTDNLDELTSRLKLKYLATDNLVLDLNYQYFDIDNGYDAFSLDNDGKTRSDEPGFDRQKTHALGIKAQNSFDWGELFVIANHSTSDMDYGYDEDWTYIGFHPWEYSSTDYYFRQRDTDTLDIRAVSNENSAWFSGNTSWVLGAYAKQSDESLSRQYTYADADFSSQYEVTNSAVYLNTQSNLQDNVTLSIGLRADNFDINYQDSNLFVERNDDTMIGGKVVLDYSIESATVYASVSRGYKAGGFNPDESVSNDKRIFRPEYNWNYELGVKGRFINHDAFIRMALFYMDREDTQISDYDVQNREDGSAEFIDIISNASNGTNWGVELESGWQINDSVYVNANLGWLDATFSGYQLADGSYIEKQEQAQAPKYTFNISSDIYFTDLLSWHVDIDGKDDFRFSDGHEERSPFTVLVNSKLSYQLGDSTLSLYVKNLFDREHYVRGFGGFSNDPREFYEIPKPYYQLGDGRQLGVALNYLF